MLSSVPAKLPSILQHCTSVRTVVGECGTREMRELGMHRKHARNKHIRRCPGILFHLVRLLTGDKAPAQLRSRFCCTGVAVEAIWRIEEFEAAKTARCLIFWPKMGVKTRVDAAHVATVAVKLGTNTASVPEEKVEDRGEHGPVVCERKGAPAVPLVPVSHETVHTGAPLHDEGTVVERDSMVDEHEMWIVRDPARRREVRPAYMEVRVLPHEVRTIWVRDGSRHNLNLLVCDIPAGRAENVPEHRHVVPRRPRFACGVEALEPGAVARIVAVNETKLGLLGRRRVRRGTGVLGVFSRRLRGLVIGRRPRRISSARVPRVRPGYRQRGADERPVWSSTQMHGRRICVLYKHVTMGGHGFLLRL